MYENFFRIDGRHPWRDVSPEGYVDYPVHYRKGGRVIYFNFELAKEMGLIPKNHRNRLTPKLEAAILKTFALQILNEYDWVNRDKFPKDHLTDRLYMATRYLQSQHKNKQGKTSGDGRSIWNGCIRKHKRTFDLSSRGTGATILSPGAQEARGEIRTGSNQYGYASGLADLDEMLSSAVMSEIFYREGIPTERCLTVIDFGDKTGIGVRTAPNLIRPAHMFRYLKMNLHKELKASFDYFIKRQKDNGAWTFSLQGKGRYLKALEQLTRTYARLVALMEEEYIFNWLAWDGDNMLADGAILDYGSIRQFAAKHDKYRYEDVDRFSTSLKEQRVEARNIVKTFAQVVDFIMKGEKRPLADFDNVSVLKLFDECYNLERQKKMLWRVGFTPEHIETLVKDHQKEIEEFRKVLDYFETIKTKEGEYEVADGVDHPPIFLVRHILRELPVFLSKNVKDNQWPQMDPESFCNEMAASYADKEDLKLTDYRKQKAIEFQQRYKDLVHAASSDPMAVLAEVTERSSVVNYEFRSTGDGVTWIVTEAIKVIDKMHQREFQEAIERFIQSQVLVPGKWKPIDQAELEGESMKSRLLRRIQKNLEIHKELI